MAYPRPPRSPAAWLALGTAVHTTFQQWELQEREWDKRTLLEFYEAEYDKEIVKLTEEQPDLSLWGMPPNTRTVESSIANYKKRGLTKDVPLYFDRCIEADWEVLRLPSGELALELPWEIDLDYKGRHVVLRGHVDKVQWWPKLGMAALEDLKTGNANDDDNDPRQLAAYAVALGVIYDIDVTYSRYWYTKLDRPSKWFDMSRWNLLTLADPYGMLDTAIDQGIFLAKPGKQCDLCGVRKSCSVLGDKSE